MINFAGVDEARDKGFTSPGTIDIFEITNIEFVESPNGKPYMKTRFENASSSFNHNFFLTEKALPRVQALATYTLDRKLDGEMTEDSLKAAFMNKKLALKVTGRVGDNGMGYADLPFGGYGKPVSKLEELTSIGFSTSEQTGIDEAIEAINASRSASPDSESSTAGTPAIAGTEEF